MILNTGRPSTSRSIQNNEAVGESLETSILHCVQRSSLQHILTKDLHLHAYEVQLIQEVKAY